VNWAEVDSMGILQLNFTIPLSLTFQAYRVSFHRGRCTCPLLAAMTLSALWTGDAGAQPISVAPPALAQEQFICRLHGTSDRRIGIYRPAGGSQRCRVDYMRDGKTRSLWSSGHDYQFCVRKALEIVGLLQQVNFTCSPQTREDAGAPSR
jgi:hypothetical protein